MSSLRKQDIFPGKLSKKQLSDAGMALTLIILLVGLFTKNDLWYKIAIPVLLVNMAVPKIYQPFAWFWYSLSNFLGFFVSRILLSLIYIVLVVPIGGIRRLFGKDSLDLKSFKKQRVSVMKERNHMYSAGDLQRPY